MFGRYLSVAYRQKTQEEFGSIEGGCDVLVDLKEVLQSLIFLQLMETFARKLAWHRQRVAAVYDYGRLEVALQRDHDTIVRPVGATGENALPTTALHRNRSTFPPKCGPSKLGQARMGC